MVGFRPKGEFRYPAIHQQILEQVHHPMTIRTLYNPARQTVEVRASNGKSFEISEEDIRFNRLDSVMEKIRALSEPDNINTPSEKIEPCPKQIKYEKNGKTVIININDSVLHNSPININLGDDGQ
jgi:hypothetical protein